MIELEQIQRTTVSSQARAALERYILVNNLPAGARLPSERELAGTLGCSRVAVREALKYLEAVGRISIEVGRGVFVSEFGWPEFADRFSSLIPWETYELQALVDARLVIETGVVDLAVERATPAELDALESIVAKWQMAESYLELVAVDQEFHAALVALAANPLVKVFASLLSVFFAKTMAESESADTMDGFSQDREWKVRIHTDLIKALRGKDAAQARRAVHEHVSPQPGNGAG